MDGVEEGLEQGVCTEEASALLSGSERDKAWA
jgi:hypothetical protein